MDQSYLWYKRDGLKLDHDIHLFAFIPHDFDRMETDNFFGYSKPKLEILQNKLHVTNIPLTKRPFYVPWLTKNIPIFKKLNLYVFYRNFINNRQLQSNQYKKHNPKNSDVFDMSKLIFKYLKRQNELKNSIFVMVLLPVEGDYYKKKVSKLKKFLYKEVKLSNMLFLDLTVDFKKLQKNEIQKFFIKKNKIKYKDSEGHYTRKGNKYVSNILYKKLISLPDIQRKLN